MVGGTSVNVCVAAKIEGIILDGMMREWFHFQQQHKGDQCPTPPPPPSQEGRKRLLPL